jgi:hypothetical protein
MSVFRYYKTDAVKCKHCGDFTEIYDHIYKAKKHRADLEGTPPAKPKPKPADQAPPKPAPAPKPKPAPAKPKPAPAATPAKSSEEKHVPTWRR